MTVFYFAANALVSWIEVVDEIAWACGRDLVATMTCGRVVRRDSLGIPIAYPAETFSKEAKLASIFWILKRMETARAGDVNGHVRTLTSEIKQTLRLHPVTRGSNISRTVVDYLR
ncbi:MAG: hypothetical protein H6849_02530 [Alphaproteobacteria bacterium]|nr:MAG: hypothetical protein H6849_02530 [Alphaproteobacteria bacterium]